MDRTRSSGAGDAARKRKRGALQDISNNAKKLSQSRASTRRGAGVVKKEAAAGEDAPKAKTKAAQASTRRKTTATTVNSALKSSMASTAASKAKKRAAVSKKTEPTRAKKRKLEGAENQPPPLQQQQHQKVQMSMLSFQTAASKPKEKATALVKKEKEDADKENVDDTQTQQVDNQAEADAVVKEEVGDTGNQTETEAAVLQLKSEVERTEETPEIQESEQRVAEAAEPAAAERRGEYSPRPYTFTYDHKSSCFDEDTYAASVRDIDAPSATTSSHHAKLVRELDSYYRKHETKYLPEADYIGTVQLDINEKMRTILVDWLVEVGEEYELDSQTFHKAVGFLFILRKSSGYDFLSSLCCFFSRLTW